MVKTRSLTVRGKRLDRRNLKKSINLNKKKQMSKKGKNSLKKSSVALVEKKNEYEYCCNAAKCEARGMTSACGCMCEDPDFIPGLGRIALQIFCWSTR